MKEMKQEIKLPVTVEGMGSLLKNICDNYIKGGINNVQFETDLKHLKGKRQDLFMAALTIRWIGKKRLSLIKSILGDMQISIDFYNTTKNSGR